MSWYQEEVPPPPRRNRPEKFDPRTAIVSRLQHLAGSRYESPRGEFGWVRLVGLEKGDDLVPYGDMTIEQLQEIVRMNEGFIKPADDRLISEDQATAILEELRSKGDQYLFDYARVMLFKRAFKKRYQGPGAPTVPPEPDKWVPF